MDGGPRRAAHDPRLGLGDSRLVGLARAKRIVKFTGSGPKWVITWRTHGLLRGYPVNDRDGLPKGDVAGQVLFIHQTPGLKAA